MLLREARRLQVDGHRRGAPDARGRFPHPGRHPRLRRGARPRAPARPPARTLPWRRHARAGSGSPAFPCRPARPGSRARSGRATRSACSSRTSAPAAPVPSSPAAAISMTSCSPALRRPTWCCSTGPSGPTTSSSASASASEPLGRWTTCRYPDRAAAWSGSAPSRPPHRVYTHINNTNPMLLEDSPERARVEQAGFQVGADGMRFTL